MKQFYYFSDASSCLSYCRYNLKKLTYDERRARLVERLNALNSATTGAEDDEDEDED